MSRYASLVTAAWLVLLLPSSLIAAKGAEPQPEQERCTCKAGVFVPGKAVEPPIALTADLSAQTVNFGADRDWKFVDVVLRASRPLPASV